MHTLGNVRVYWWRHAAPGPFAVDRFDHHAAGAGRSTWIRVGPLEFRWWRP